MEFQTDVLGMLDLLTAPGFCVKNGQIIHANAAAQGVLFSTGMAIEGLLHTGKEEYARFSEGCLYLSLVCSGKTWGAAVTRKKDLDIFVLEQAPSQPELQALALAARELRAPLSSAMLITDQLLQEHSDEKNASVSRLNRGLYQMLRIIENMSDSEQWFAASCQEVRNITMLMGEIFDKAQLYAAQAGVSLTCTVPEETVYTLCNGEQLERAVLNMLSNSIKFSPAGGSIAASLTRQGHTLRLSIQDSGSGISDDILGTVFTRYLRKPAIEDGRHGIGLGMVLIRNTATSHGGTVLIDRPEGGGTRVTMTLQIRSNGDGALRSPLCRPVLSSYDSSLIHLSEVLPPSMYDGSR